MAPLKLDSILAIADRHDPRQLAVRAALDLLPSPAGRLRIAGFAYEHAADEPGVLSARPAAALKDALLDARRQWLQQKLAALRVDPGQTRVEVVWTKDVVDWTIDTVSRDDIDLVAKTGSHRESLFYTPTDWHLLRRCPAPVLIAGNRPSKRRRRILATVDAGSSHPVRIALNRKVLGAAAHLGARLSAQVHVVYVPEVSAVARDLDLIDARALTRNARRKVGPSLAAMSGEHGIPADNIVIKSGQPERVVPSLAAKLGVDTVVMGTVGRTGISGKLLGNTAEQVLHRLRTSLLALRPD